MSTSNTLFSVVSFVAFLLVCIPLPWHLRAWNVGTCLYIVWTALGTLMYFINSIVWNDNAINWAPVWCDISAKLIIGLSIAIPASSLCINRGLYNLTTLQAITWSKSEKSRTIKTDLAIGVGTPVLVMALQYIVQGHRFDIFEEIGCYPETYWTPPAFVLVASPPLVLSLISGSYSIRSIITLRRKQETKKTFFETPDLNASLYFRLLALASLDVLIAIPLCIYAIVGNSVSIMPWISWENTHWRFSRVDQIPSLIWKNNPKLRTGLEVTRWSTVFCALTFFAFFGLAKEARRHYKMAWHSFAKYIGYISPKEWTSSLGKRFGSRPPTDLPISFRTDQKRGTFDSVSEQGSMYEEPVLNFPVTAYILPSTTWSEHQTSKPPTSRNSLVDK